MEGGELTVRGGFSQGSTPLKKNLEPRAKRPMELVVKGRARTQSNAEKMDKGKGRGK